jgi:uncharacterized protein
MSPRIKILRKVCSPPIIRGLKPYGEDIEKFNAEPISLLFEEYEALKLCDYDKLTHLEASKLMGVSRPTFTRIYASVRQKIAQAFVEGRQITIEGGKVYFDSDWYHCSNCNCNFNNPNKSKQIFACPLCSSTNIKEFDDKIFSFDNNSKDCLDTCVCPECGVEIMLTNQESCLGLICPECQTRINKE